MMKLPFLSPTWTMNSIKNVHYQDPQLIHPEVCYYYFQIFREIDFLKIQFHEFCLFVYFLLMMFVYIFLHRNAPLKNRMWNGYGSLEP